MKTRSPKCWALPILVVFHFRPETFGYVLDMPKIIKQSPSPSLMKLKITLRSDIADSRAKERESHTVLTPYVTKPWRLNIIWVCVIASWNNTPWKKVMLFHRAQIQAELIKRTIDLHIATCHSLKAVVCARVWKIPGHGVNLRIRI